MASEPKTVQIRVRGKVQGVFYRASAKEAADRIGIRGWVRNCADGSVEALAIGDEEQLAAFVNWCRRGPGGARVQEVQVNDYPGAELPEGFSIRR